MTDGEKYAMIAACSREYCKIPHDVSKVEVVQTANKDYPEVVEIHWKSGGKSAIGNREVVELAKPLIGDLEALRGLLLERAESDLKALRPAAKAEAERTRPWTYILGVLDDNGNRVEKYSWTEDNSWELFGNSDAELLRSRIERCREYRSSSTSRWHVYRRMRGDTKLQEVF